MPSVGLRGRRPGDDVLPGRRRVFSRLLRRYKCATRKPELRNDSGNANNWLAVRVIGADDNRDGAGTRIHLRTGDKSQWREINGAASYLSHNDLRAYFGLNKQEKIDRIEITWPNGDTDAIDDLPANKLLVVRQGQGHTLHTLGPEH